ncbi:hypothetical protein CMUS01_08969 [Colletotrichum musicola]|uniref:Uncharacterized protein n=1 Tax=Colletotrichum musicola TaxID=2175873 RepID=A0A8H6K9K5_9PEZI|nr:hypothetical protein CMUS01_08969 [Colletotrichum musicola]
MVSHDNPSQACGAEKSLRSIHPKPQRPGGLLTTSEPAVAESPGANLLATRSWVADSAAVAPDEGVDPTTAQRFSRFEAPRVSRLALGRIEFSLAVSGGNGRRDEMLEREIYVLVIWKRRTLGWSLATKQVLWKAQWCPRWMRSIAYSSAGSQVPAVIIASTPSRSWGGKVCILPVRVRVHQVTSRLQDEREDSDAFTLNNCGLARPGLQSTSPVEPWWRPGWDDGGTAEMPVLATGRSSRRHLRLQFDGFSVLSTTAAAGPGRLKGARQGVPRYAEHLPTDRSTVVLHCEDEERLGRAHRRAVPRATDSSHIADGAQAQQIHGLLPAAAGWAPATSEESVHPAQLTLASRSGLLVWVGLTRFNTHIPPTAGVWPGGPLSSMLQLVFVLACP